MTRRALAATIPVVLLGGALGGTARYAVGVLGPHALFPWGTLAINLVGSLLLALLPVFRFVHRHHTIPSFLGTGVLGGFTERWSTEATATSLRRTSWDRWAPASPECSPYVT